MTGSLDVRADILKAIPHLRAFAISLTGDVDRADDLVQEAIVRGLSHLDSFTPGTNMQAWLFTILRNQFHTSYRKRRREVEDPDGQYAARLAVATRRPPGSPASPRSRMCPAAWRNVW